MAQMKALHHANEENYTYLSSRSPSERISKLGGVASFGSNLELPWELQFSMQKFDHLL